VKFIRAEELTAVCVWAQRTAASVEARLRAEVVAHGLTRQELARARQEADRFRAQVDRLVAALAAGERVEVFRCGHPRVEWNVYRHRGTDPAGRKFCREYCRECNVRRAAAYRVRKNAAQGTRSHITCDDFVGLRA